MKTFRVKTSNVSSCSCNGGSGTACSTQKLEKPIQVSTQLTFCDTLGSWKARWGINRMDYKIDPGLYYVGSPDNNSPVLVTANYKMTFDRLRKELTGLSLWILVLDTKGINVWCAAGKGTFGTNELVNRINKVKLTSVVSHRSIILPQLGAPGIAAHEVQKQSGFKITYGPVRASDIKDFINSGMKADIKMRTVNFTFMDRLVLTPIEIAAALKKSMIVFGLLFILNSIGFGHYGFVDLYALLGAILIGCVMTPVLLPWIPGRAFSFKGWLLGLLWAVSVNLLNGYPGVPSYGWLKAAAFMLIIPGISAYLALNFTGCSTYTSFSGVKLEIKRSVPLMIISTGLGIVLLIVDSFIKLFS